MKSIKEANFNKKIALVRCDFNISIHKDGTIPDDFRIRETIPTILEILNRGGRVILMSHFSDRKTGEVFIPILEKFLKRRVGFLKKISSPPDGDIFFLENLRSFKGEEENDEKFAIKLAGIGDIYVNEAFSVSHREHASVVWLPKLLPSYAGFRLILETKVLSKIRDNPLHPLVVIIGGAKTASKLKVVESFFNSAEHILFGGKVANEILTIKGICLNRSWPDEEVIKAVEKIDITSRKIHLPIDLVISSTNGGSYLRTGAAGSVTKGEEIYDIGNETIELYTKIIEEAKMLIWAGPLGLFERREFENGTREIAKAIATNHKAFKVIGGGDTGIAATKFHIRELIDHISTGGGAMLSFLANQELPGLKALGYYEKD